MCAFMTDRIFQSRFVVYAIVMHFPGHRIKNINFNFNSYFKSLRSECKYLNTVIALTLIYKSIQIGKYSAATQISVDQWQRQADLRQLRKRVLTLKIKLNMKFCDKLNFYLKPNLKFKQKLLKRLKFNSASI